MFMKSTLQLLLKAGFTAVAIFGLCSVAEAAPCDIFASDGHACVAAYSTVRNLNSGYGGALYQVTRASDGATLDIGAVNGFGDSGSQDNFCNGTSCTISIIYDQSGNGNDLPVGFGCGGQPYCVGQGPNNSQIPADAGALPVTAYGNRVYGVSFPTGGGVGYRRAGPANNIPTGGAPQGIYMVTSTNQVNGVCCFDFGNVETYPTDTGSGHMDAINIIGGGDSFAIGLDIEDGIFPNDTGNSLTIGPTAFATIAGWNDGQQYYDVYAGNAQSSDPLREFGVTQLQDRYRPMQQEGGIVLGVGGDASGGQAGGDGGEFFEGAMTAGVPSTGAFQAVQADIAGIGYQ